METFTKLFGSLIVFVYHFCISLLRPGCHQRVPQIPARRRQAVRRGRGQDQAGSTLQRQVGADDQHGFAGAGGGAEVQATVDGGRCLSLDEVAAGYPADLSQVRRDDSRARVLLVSGAAVAQGTRSPFGAQAVEAGMGRRGPGPGTTWWKWKLRSTATGTFFAARRRA